ncbi:hypothetical protein BS78_05G102200 [Paspalum vaginatum]|nr:hypothetical protein BS78_05G102200 [Paspalum vaginatum]
MDAQSVKDLVLAQRELFHLGLSFLESMALKCTVDLGIPNAIHLHGGSTTLSDVVDGIRLPESRKLYVRRIMNLLTISGIFTEDVGGHGNQGDEALVVYKLTPTSHLLVDGNKLGSMAPLVQFLVYPLIVPTFSWLKKGEGWNLFEMAHGCSRHEMAMRNGDDNACSVLDLPHVVSQAHGDGTVQFIAGHMFEHIPKADAVLLKVITIDAVIGAGPPDMASKETHAPYDFHMVCIDGIERDERGWQKIILEAGFSAYKIVSVVAIHSVLEVYP